MPFYSNSSQGTVVHTTGGFYDQGKILANDGISEKGIDLLSKAGHEVITVNVAQDQLINYINE